MTEISERYRRLAAGFGDRIDEVSPGGWGSPSPCEGWTALDVVKHVIDTQGMFLGFIDEKPDVLADVEVDPLGAWKAASGAVQSRLDDPSRAGMRFQGFFGETSFEEAVDRFLAFDLIVHRWDLARATGGDESIDDAEIRRVVDGAAAFGDALRSPGVCGPALDPPAGADAKTRMLALLGRRA